MSRALSLAVASVLAGVLVCAGCGTAPAAGDQNRETAHMKVLGLLYGQYMSSNGGVPPASQDQFVAYLQREPANWEKLAGSAEEFLNSPRSGQPLVVIYGKQDLKTPADGGLPWVAYEREGVAGKHLIANLRGHVQLVEQAELAQLFPTP